MTTVLLDTHVLQWWTAEPRRVSKRASEAIAAADEVAVSAISWFELAWLAENGRISVAVLVRSWLDQDLIPVLTVIGLQVGVLFTGAILTETIFSWPGVGKWLIEAIGRRDYPVLQGGILLIGIVVMAVNLAVDLAYGIINPRIRHVR